MGDHVKVIAGRYEGDTGLIVRVEENFVILFSDLTMHEVPAHIISCYVAMLFAELYRPNLSALVVLKCAAVGHENPECSQVLLFCLIAT